MQAQYGPGDQEAPETDYEIGHEAYKNKSYTLALEHFRSGAAAGDRQSQYALGLMYERGQGVPQDFATAASLYKDAIRGTGRDWIVAAKLRLAHLYMAGKGVRKSPEIALEYYSEIGDLWLDEALNEIAWKLATNDDARYPDLAILFARRAAGGFNVQFDEKLEMQYLDTLAAAYAAAGRFREAMREQRRAIGLARKYGTRDIAGYKARMRLYMRGRMLTCPSAACD